MTGRFCGTVLHAAVRGGAFELVPALIEAVAEIDAGDNQEKTPHVPCSAR